MTTVSISDIGAPHSLTVAGDMWTKLRASVAPNECVARVKRGTLELKGHKYQFRSSGDGSLPKGTYRVSHFVDHSASRTARVAGVAYEFALSTKYDPRAPATLAQLRIHPDGGAPGGNGAVAIVGGPDVQRRFLDDMLSELDRCGGHYSVRVV